MNNNSFRTQPASTPRKRVVLLGMRNLRSRLASISPVSLSVALVGMLVVSYIGLIAVVMSSAALTVEFSQSVKNDESVVATLESQYLDGVALLTKIDYGAAGYATPLTKTFVPTKSATAHR